MNDANTRKYDEYVSAQVKRYVDPIWNEKKTRYSDTLFPVNLRPNLKIKLKLCIEIECFIRSANVVDRSNKYASSLWNVFRSHSSKDKCETSTWGKRTSERRERLSERSLFHGRKIVTKARKRVVHFTLLNWHRQFSLCFRFRFISSPLAIWKWINHILPAWRSSSSRGRSILFDSIVFEKVKKKKKRLSRSERTSVELFARIDKFRFDTNDVQPIVSFFNLTTQSERENENVVHHAERTDTKRRTGNWRRQRWKYSRPIDRERCKFRWRNRSRRNSSSVEFVPSDRTCCPLLFDENRSFRRPRTIFRQFSRTEFERISANIRDSSLFSRLERVRSRLTLEIDSTVHDEVPMPIDWSLTTGNARRDLPKKILRRWGFVQRRKRKGEKDEEDFDSSIKSRRRRNDLIVRAFYKLSSNLGAKVFPTAAAATFPSMNPQAWHLPRHCLLLSRDWLTADEWIESANHRPWESSSLVHQPSVDEMKRFPWDGAKGAWRSFFDLERTHLIVCVFRGSNSVER